MKEDEEEELLRYDKSVAQPILDAIEAALEDRETSTLLFKKLKGCKRLLKKVLCNA